MGYWNTRIIKHNVSETFKNGKEYHEIWYGVHEVYYDEKGNIIGWTQEPIDVMFEDKYEFVDVLNSIVEASKHPILEELKDKDGNNYIEKTNIMLDNLEENDG